MNASILRVNTFKTSVPIVCAHYRTLAVRNLSITRLAAAMSGEQGTAKPVVNVLGEALECCCTSPVTGYFRDGYCRTDASDQGRHVICAQVTQEFLEYSARQGNNLMTPAPQFNFPGLKPGDKWCLCALRWREAMIAGCAPNVFLKCTHAKALELITLQDLQKYAAQDEA
eukprot:gene31188-6333_t